MHVHVHVHTHDEGAGEECAVCMSPLEREAGQGLVLGFLDEGARHKGLARGG